MKKMFGLNVPYFVRRRKKIESLFQDEDLLPYLILSKRCCVYHSAYAVRGYWEKQETTIFSRDGDTGPLFFTVSHHPISETLLFFLVEENPIFRIPIFCFLLIIQAIFSISIHPKNQFGTGYSLPKQSCCTHSSWPEMDVWRIRS